MATVHINPMSRRHPGSLLDVPQTAGIRQSAVPEVCPARGIPGHLQLAKALRGIHYRPQEWPVGEQLFYRPRRQSKPIPSESTRSSTERI